MDIAPSNDPKFTSASAAYTGSAGSTSAWPPGPSGVLVWTTTDAYVRVGDAVTATTADTPVPAYTPITIAVPYNVVSWRVSAIQISAGGTVYAKPIMGT